MQEFGVAREGRARVPARSNQPPGVRLGRAERAHGRRVLPRREEARRAALRRPEHLPVRAAGSSVRRCSAACLRPWVTSRPSPTRWASSRSASPPPRVVRSRRCRRCTCPPTTTPTPPVHHVHPPRRDHRAVRVRSRRSVSTRRSTRWRRPPTSWRPRSSVPGTTPAPGEPRRSSSATRSSRTSSPSSVSTSSPKKTA